MKCVTLFVSIVFLIACQVRTTGDAESDGGQSLSAQDSGQIKEKASPSGSDEEFQVFWRNFRDAALSHDSGQMVSLVQFPLKTRGTFDSDPVIEYKKEKAMPIIQAFFNQRAGIDQEGSTEMDIVRKTLFVDNVNVHDGYIRVGDMVFQKQLDVGWKLTFLYLNNDALDSLSK
jgi:hypothetical protein